MVTIFCAIVGDSEKTFPVDIAESETVGHLKKAIKKATSATITCDGKDLQLFLAKNGDKWFTYVDLGEGVVSTDGLEPLSMAGAPLDLVGLSELDVQYQVTKKDVKDGTIPVHVLVKIPPTSINAPVSDGTDLWLVNFHRSVVAANALPPRGDLKDFVGRELPVKIGLPQSVLDTWSKVPLSLGNVLQSKLFEVNNVSPCELLKDSVFSSPFLNPKVDGVGTESAFHHFWDTSIRLVLEFVFPRSYVNRDSNRNSSLNCKRPDFLFALDHICVFRGEEKAPGIDITVPRNELSDKLEWSYGGVPYVLGYAASGFELELFAICHDTTVSAHFIEGFNLRLASERFRLVLALLNLCLLFPAIAQNCPASARNEYMDILRSNGVKLCLNPTFVDKIFPTKQEFLRVKEIYNALMPLEIPSVDNIVAVDKDKLRLTFSPRGVEVKPSSLRELFVALRNVLETLVVLHLNGWMHRDIRWSNVIKRRDRVGWFLIDFVDAATSPQNYPNGDHLTRNEHAPEIFVEGGSHSTAVDLWAVGMLVKKSGNEVEWRANKERAGFQDQLMNADSAARPTADGALQLLLSFEAAEQTLQNTRLRKRNKRR